MFFLSLPAKTFKMKKILFSLFFCFIASISFADGILFEGFEYGNHDMTPPVGWVCDDNSWLAGYLEKDHNRIAHTGNWYAFTDADDSWMFMEFFMSDDLRYRYHFWAISDGEYDVEFWAGSGPSSSEMTTLLMTRTVNSEEYQHFTEYIESVATDYQYFGIHATAHQGASFLTIDDIEVDMVDKYGLNVDPHIFNVSMMPGEQITIEYDVQNTGYEDLTIFMTPYTDYFSNISLTVEGAAYSPFPTVANQSVHCSCTATLNPDVELGSYVWMDIMFTVSCDCVTSMATLWVNVGDPTGIEEFENEQSTQRVELFDLTGKKVDPSHLKPGIYIEKTSSEKNVSTRKIVKQ